LLFQITIITTSAAMATCYEGHRYWLNKTRENKSYYNCSKAFQSGCKGKLIVTSKNNENQCYHTIGQHICGEDQDTTTVWCEDIGEMEASERDIKFKHPCTTLVAGPTGSGKTVLVRKLLQDHANLFDNINTKELKVTWCYGQWQSSYSKAVPNVNISYVEGLIDQAYVQQHKPQLVVIDDLMTELGGNKELANLFTKGSHHLNISVIFIVQNVFHQAPQMRTISLNSHYMILLKNPRDKSQIMSLARQLYPTNTKYLQEVYKDATSRPFGYLLLDLTPDTPEELRCRTLITSSDVPDKYKQTSGLCPIIYQEDGKGGKFTKSYSMLEGISHQSGGGDNTQEMSSDVVSPINTPIAEKVPTVSKRNDLRDCLHRLDVVARTKDLRRRRTLLRELSHDDMINRTLQLVAKNTINMRIPLEKHHKQKLLKHSKVIQELGRKKISKVRSKKLVEQSGGFLPILIPLAIDLATDLLEEYI
jgi:hypothetical protein